MLTQSSVVAEIQPQPFPKSTFPAQVTWAGAPPRRAGVLKAVDHLGTTPQHWLGFWVWLVQHVPHWLTTSQCGEHIIQGHSAPACGPQARAFWLSVGLFYDSQSWSPRCRLLSSLWCHREESIGGKAILKKVFANGCLCLAFSFSRTSSGILFFHSYLLPDLLPDISREISMRPLLWLFWHFPDRLAPRLWGSLDSSSGFIRKVFLKTKFIFMKYL